MTERPIIFSGEEVRAILADRKTQDRRLVKPHHMATVDADRFPILALCPYGSPGDRLWVRETCRAEAIGDEGLCGVRYVADGQFMPIANTREASDRWVQLYWYRGREGATVPAIHMPRWASRITLEITGVRVERLQDISEDDIIDEGTAVRVKSRLPPVQQCGEYDVLDIDPVAEFAEQWESIYGPGSWDANRWVWVIEFERVTA
jgi:hypothetical protein